MPSHPIVSGLVNNNYYDWNYVSHGFFTNSPPNAHTILTDTIRIPPDSCGIHLRQAGRSSDPCKRLNGLSATGGLPLKNTLSYADCTGEEEPCWSRMGIPGVTTSNQNTLSTLGIPYDICASTDFATKDLSQYSVIIIASDQITPRSTTELDANLHKLGMLLAGGGGGSDHYIWNTTIFSHNYDNGKDTTYDGGSYYGVIGGNRVANELKGDIYLIYIDPSGNAGIIRGNTSGQIYPDINSFSGEGNAYPIELIREHRDPARESEGQHRDRTHAHDR